MSSLKLIIKAYTPVKVWEGLAKVKGLVIYYTNRLYDFYLIKKAPSRHQKALEIVRKKEKIKVAFFLIHDSVWKYEGVYELMEKDTRFDPIVVVCPYMVFGKDNMIFEMNNNFDNFKRKGYNVVKSFNEKTEGWMDVKKEIQPDFVFFTNPHSLTKEEYYIDNFVDTLTCYVPYSFQVSNLYKEQFDQPFHSKIWKQFYETEKHKQIGEKYSSSKGKNIIVTGYPGVDSYINRKKGSDPWPKVKNKSFKKIIWAPHHTIPGEDSGLGYSSFLDLADFMIDIAEKYNDKIQIAFKPHPILKSKLYLNGSWGKDRTDHYFRTWEELENTFIANSEYSDLFCFSDALIHDSGSFTAEYLILNKPVMFTVNNSDVLNNFNEFGKECLKRHYLGFTKSEIIEFIEDKVLGMNDLMKSEREQFVKESCLPPNDKSASLNIMEYINKLIEN